VVALGRKDGLPIGIHPLVSVLARPVKHVRLVTALLKAAALMQHKAQHVPLHGSARKCASSRMLCHCVSQELTFADPTLRSPTT